MLSLIKQIPPPSSKFGWPWTKGSEPLPSVMPNGKPWPKISIVTPSYNQGQFLEETIRSVLLQNYPNIEYIIMDGGSTDNSVEIIKKYEPWLTYWVSEKDNGQADAIYRGFERATEDIIAWINSDDFYLPGAISNAVRSLINNSNSSLVVGSSYHLSPESKYVRKYYGFSQSFDSLLLNGMHFCQPACFWKRDKFFALGGFNRNLRFCFDYDMFLRFRKDGQFAITLHPTAVFRWHEESKSSTIADVAQKENVYLRGSYGYPEGTDCSKIIAECHRQIQRSSRLGRVSDLWFDPKWLFRRWIPYTP